MTAALIAIVIALGVAVAGCVIALAVRVARREPAVIARGRPGIEPRTVNCFFVISPRDPAEVARVAEIIRRQQDP